jgi:hypothetical protein
MTSMMEDVAIKTRHAFLQARGRDSNLVGFGGELSLEKLLQLNLPFIGDCPFIGLNANLAPLDR